MSLTLEQKAAAFDLICELLRDQGQFVRYRQVPSVDTSDRRPGTTVHRMQSYRAVPEYRFVLLADDQSFLKAITRKIITKG
jgi:hypothetical protein